ncbi:MAG: twin-arginine translocase subunit TatC [Desulfurococcales archaeon]|nr:twin-arginine translocase subunit TatC [Desulfurococcales archaeon]
MELAVRLKRIVVALIISTLVLSFIPVSVDPYIPAVNVLPKKLIEHAVPPTISFLGQTYEVRLAQFNPFGGFNVLFKSALMLGLLGASPVIIRETFAYIKPALYPHEERAIKKYSILAFILFAAGILLAYYVVIPIAFRFMFMTSIMVAGEEGLVAFADIEKLFTLAVQLILATGLLFEVPLVTYMLLAAGILEPGFFTGDRMKYAFIISLVIGAVISPDPSGLGMLVIAIPYYALFYIAVKLGIRSYKRRIEKTAREEFLEVEEPITAPGQGA